MSRARAVTRTALRRQSVCEGYLQIQSGRGLIRRWRSCFFQLSSSVLSQFNGSLHSDASLRGTMDMRSLSSVDFDASAEADIVLVFVAGSKEVKLRAHSPNNAVLWANALLRASQGAAKPGREACKRGVTGRDEVTPAARDRGRGRAVSRAEANRRDHHNGTRARSVSNKDGEGRGRCLSHHSSAADPLGLYRGHGHPLPKHGSKKHLRALPHTSSAPTMGSAITTPALSEPDHAASLVDVTVPASSPAAATEAAAHRRHNHKRHPNLGADHLTRAPAPVAAPPRPPGDASAAVEARGVAADGGEGGTEGGDAAAALPMSTEPPAVRGDARSLMMSARFMDADAARSAALGMPRLAVLPDAAKEKANTGAASSTATEAMTAAAVAPGCGPAAGRSRAKLLEVKFAHSRGTHAYEEASACVARVLRLRASGRISASAEEWLAERLLEHSHEVMEALSLDADADAGTLAAEAAVASAASAAANPYSKDAYYAEGGLREQQAARIAAADDAALLLLDPLLATLVESEHREEKRVGHRKARSRPLKRLQHAASMIMAVNRMGRFMSAEKRREEADAEAAARAAEGGAEGGAGAKTTHDRHVSFGVVRVLFFERTLGESVTFDGPPIGLSWQRVAARERLNSEEAFEAQTVKWEEEQRAAGREVPARAEPSEEEATSAAVRGTVCEVDGAEEYSIDDWELKREPFRIPREDYPDEGKVDAPERVVWLRAAGHRRCSIDLATFQQAQLRRFRGKNGRSKAPRMVMEGRDPDEVHAWEKEQLALAAIKALMRKWRRLARASTKRRAAEVASGRSGDGTEERAGSSSSGHQFQNPLASTHKPET